MIPSLTPLAQRVYSGLKPLSSQDAANGYALAYYIAGISRMFDQIETYARDTPDGDPGWSILLDLNRCPSEALPFLAQFVGVTLTAGLTDAQWRDQIRAVSNFQRGSVLAIQAAAKLYLTGTQTIIFRERDPAACPTFPAYGLTVISLTAETPDSSKVLSALIAAKPAGIILNYEVLDGQDYQLIYDDFATYQALYDAYLTYQGVINNQPGT